MNIRIRSLWLGFLFIALSTAAMAATKATAARAATLPNEIRITMPGAPGQDRYLVHRCPANVPHPNSFVAPVHDAICPPTGGVSFPSAGAGAADDPHQSDPDRADAGTHIFPDAAGGSLHLRPGRASPGTGTHFSHGCAGTGLRSHAPIHVALCTRERCFVIRRTGKRTPSAESNDLSMRVVVPAYILSELKAGFQIGAILFLPFMVIDMVVASITTSVGMFQLPPVVISTPFKLLLFVMVDGWNLLVGSLMRSFS